MQMSTEHGFAFLCMPKCASTSVELAISEFCNINYSGHPCIKHVNAQVFTESILPVHQQLVPTAQVKSYCLMRDPLDWVQSWFRYRGREELKSPSHPNHRNYTGNLSYDDFISEYLSTGEKQSYAQLSTQLKFLRLSDGQIGVDYVIPMTKIDSLIKIFEEKIQQPINIPFVNASPKVDIALDSSLEQQLRKYLAQDIYFYEFIESHGMFDQALHSSEVAAALQAV